MWLWNIKWLYQWEVYFESIPLQSRRGPETTHHKIGGYKVVHSKLDMRYSREQKWTTWANGQVFVLSVNSALVLLPEFFFFYGHMESHFIPTCRTEKKMTNWVHRRVSWMSVQTKTVSSTTSLLWHPWKKKFILKAVLQVVHRVTPCVWREMGQSRTQVHCQKVWLIGYRLVRKKKNGAGKSWG